MNNEEQRQLLAKLMDRIKYDLLEHSEHWSEEWNGIELRWLIKAAVDTEQPTRKGRRYRTFRNELTVKNLY